MMWKAKKHLHLVTHLVSMTQNLYVGLITDGINLITLLKWLGGSAQSHTQKYN